MEPVYTYLSGNKRAYVFDNGVVELFIDNNLSETYSTESVEAANNLAVSLVGG